MSKKHYSLFVLFFLLSLVVYFPTRQAGFVMDFLAWQEKFNHHSITDAFTNFGFHAQQQFFLLLFYSMYKLFSLNGFYWYLVFSFLQALNGWLLFRLFIRMFQRFPVKNSFFIALTGTVLFLLSPYNTEVVVWKVCLHYLVTALLLLLMLHAALSFFETGKKMYLLESFICYLLALFSFELAIIIPVAVLVFAIFWNAGIEKDKKWYKKTALLVAPQILLLPFYFLLDQWMFGSMVGHYGASVHFNVNFFSVVSEYLKYIVKYLFFLRYFKYQVKMPIFDFFNNHAVVIIAFAFLLIVFAIGIFYFIKLSSGMRLAAMCLLLFFILLTPTINLYMSTMLLSENDRYGYVPSMFFFPVISLFLFALPVFIRFTLIAGYLIISVVLLVYTTSLWTNANKVYFGLINDFRWYDKSEVYLLNIPDNYNGVWMFRIYNEPSELPECLDLIRNKPYLGKITDVAQFNMMEPNAGVSVSADSLKQIHVKWNQWGNWWWRQGVGAGDYETDEYAVHFVDDGYVLRFKKYDANSAIVYQVGDKWKEFKMP